MTYKRIMIAVDGSKTSDLAFTEALELAKGLHTKLCIFHMIEALPTHAAFAIDVDKYQRISHEKGDELLAKLKQAATAANVDAETKLIEISSVKESIADKIVQTAKDWQANLLVMGTHGRTGLSRLMLGSVAEETLKSINIPILLVRETQ